MLKEKYLGLVNLLFSRLDFKDLEVTASLIGRDDFYSEPLKRFKDNRVNDDSKNKILDAVNSMGDLIGFNISFRKNKGDYINGYNWNTSTFVFWNGSDNPDKPSLLPKFDYNRLDNLLSEYHLANKLSRADYESDERYDRISGNYFEWDKINEKIDLMMKLDNLLDRTVEDLEKIQDLLKTELV